MKKTTHNMISIALCTAAIITLLSGCTGNIRHAIGIKKQGPDEFKVIANSPLSIPPNFTLLPPVPGAKRPQDVPIAEQAKETLFQKSTKAPTIHFKQSSSAENALLKKANTGQADPNIKSILNSEQGTSNDGTSSDSFLGNILSNNIDGQAGASGDPIVNAMQEKQRIDGNKAQGKPVNEGETPTIDPQQSDGGLFNRIFGL